MQAAPETRQSLGRVALPVLGCALGLLEAFHPTLLSGFGRIQTDVGDTRFNNFILEHGYRWITGQTSSFWDAPFFFPIRNAAAYSDTLLGAAPLYWLWRLVGFLPDTAFQLWQLSVSVLNFAVFYWFAKRTFSISVLAAVAGAEIFAFGGPRIAQTLHIQLFPQFFSLFVLHSLIELFRSDLPARVARRCWLVIAAAFTLQLYASYYLAWFLFFGLFVALVWALAKSTSRQRVFGVLKRDAASIALAAIVTVIAVLPMVIHYVQAARETGLRQWFSVSDLLPRPLSWFAGDKGSWFYSWTLHLDSVAAVPFPHEQSLTFGLLTLAVAAYGLWPHRREPLVRLLLRVSLTLVILTTLFSPGRTLWQTVWAVFPGAKALRAVARVVLLIGIPVSLGVALGIDRLQARGRLVAGLLAALCLLEQAHTTPSFDKAEVRARVAAEAKQVPEGCGAFYLSPVKALAEQPDWLIQVDAMWVALATRTQTLNGYSGNHPHDWPLKDSVILTPADEPRLADALKAWEAKHGLDARRICWVRFAE